MTSVDFIKIDVDGHELDVLKSGEKFLAKEKPVIFIVMGLLSNESNFLKRNFYKLLLNKIKLVSISKNEKIFLESKIFNK